MVAIKNLMTASILILMMLGYSMQAILISLSLLGVITIIYYGRRREDGQ
jgi:hypothetical protein